MPVEVEQPSDVKSKKVHGKPLKKPIATAVSPPQTQVGSSDSFGGAGEESEGESQVLNCGVDDNTTSQVPEAPKNPGPNDPDGSDSNGPNVPNPPGPTGGGPGNLPPVLIIPVAMPAQAPAADEQVESLPEPLVQCNCRVGDRDPSVWDYEYVLGWACTFAWTILVLVTLYFHASQLSLGNAFELFCLFPIDTFYKWIDAITLWNFINLIDSYTTWEYINYSLVSLWVAMELAWRTFVLGVVVLTLPHFWRKFSEWVYARLPEMYDPRTGERIGKPIRSRECYSCAICRIARTHKIKREVLAIASQVLLMVPRTVANAQSCKYRILQKLREFSPDAAELELTDAYLRCITALAKESPGEKQLIKRFSSDRAKTWTERINEFLRPSAEGCLPSK